ncbi:hypothetical protein BP5796_01596 [Coleophoma crateriformis]|uniref:Xylanolytic transcriptional activator regulatory domain-containing protein n=1 Tax=Coleophoma crateriformis TaxID=565419 RepID=A0A3D8T0V1_9HELO|nr:hypothetical protein BP5796_01596 [Coleophoma crateriformis]
MRCDHTLPTCLNCERRKIVERCIYLSAPETRPHNKRSTGSTSSLVSPIRDSSLNDQLPGLELLNAPGSSDEDNADDDAAILKPSSGFFGPTSFSAVFLDSKDGLASDVTSPSKDDEHHAHFQEEIKVNAYRVNEEQDAHMTLGVKVLGRLPDQATCQRIVEVYTGKNMYGMDKSFHKPALIHCMASLWSTFGVALNAPRNQRNIKEMAKILTRNTKSILRDTEDGASWLASISGWKVRWEMIGILFATLGNTALSILETDPFWATQPGSRKSRIQFASEMVQCSNWCIQLSSQKDNINYLMISLLFKRTILESQCTGDTSLVLWRQHGDLTAATTGLGLHRAQDLAAPVTISSEMRRRIWAVVFAVDKTLATFTGRPPGLSHRYMSCPMPLDLSDDILLAPREEIEKAISELDSNGWNTKGELYTATNLRANMVHALISSEILEIALGNSSQYSDERLMDLKIRNEQTLNSYPPWLHYNKDFANPHYLQWTRLSLRFRYLNCCLLLEQLWTKRGNADKQPLLDVAREMLELTVFMWTERDQFRDRHYDYDFMIMFYGIPAAGVICVELLRQMKQSAPTHLHVPRSEVIPNLSLLVGFLDWVQPTAANKQLCIRMRAVIKGILDRILDAPPALEIAPALDHFDIAQMDVDDLKWLDSIDWTRGPFVDLGMDGLDGYANFS